MIAAIVGMPIVLMAVTLVAGAVLRKHPTKDDIWQLPKVSSVSLAFQRA